jgi:hypothetical protein
MFVPLLDKLNKIVPELHQQEEFDYYCSILPKMIANGHTAHQIYSRFMKLANLRLRLLDGSME